MYDKADRSFNDHLEKMRKIPSHGEKGIPSYEGERTAERDRAREITWQNPQTRELRPRSNCEYDYA